MNNGLTSFRAFAFFVVFLFHENIFAFGYLGVQAFFVLSGFLLTPILADMKKSLTKRDYFVNFYGRRALRIFPAYYLYLFVVAILSLLITSIEPYQDMKEINSFLQQLPWALTYTYNFYLASASYEFTSMGSHFWSLAVEEQFYLIWPVLLFFVPHRHLKNFLLAIILIGPLIRFFISYLVSNNTISFLSNDLELIVYVLPFSQMDAFAIGGFFALFQINKSARLVWIVIIAVFTTGVVTELMFSANYFQMSGVGYQPLMKDSFKYIWGYSALNFMFAFILISIREGVFIPRFLENPILIYLGKISYGMYIFHYPVIYSVKILLTYQKGYIHILLCFLITIVISAMSYELVEKRFIGLKHKYFSNNPVDKTTTNNLVQPETKQPSSK